MKITLYKNCTGIVKTKDEWLRSIRNDDNPYVHKNDSISAEQIFEYMITNGFITSFELE